VVLAIPAPQAQDLLASAGPAAPAALATMTGRAVMAPCWALLLAFDPPWTCRLRRPVGGERSDRLDRA
jgi:predicted NAD/FAD-dependent oxidoreductase